MKQLDAQRHIFKLESKRLRKANWDLTLSLEEAVKLDEVVALGSSQLFRWIDELSTLKNKTKDKLFQAEIVSIKFDTVSDFKKACKKQFSINGIKYKRLLGTAGGIKNNTVLFIMDSLHEEINKRIDNGRNLEQQLVVAKFEAYRALVASQSHAVSMPNGVVVVKDVITHFKDNVVYVDDHNGDWLEIKEVSDFEVELNANDGFGLCKPSLIERWSKEVEEETLGGVCIRNAFTKGMIYPFDLDLFAKEVAHKDTIVDVWGKEHNIKDIELILTESMLKLNVGAYESMEHYLKCCEENHYTYAICKIVENELDDERKLNYQYLQSFEMSEEDMKALCEPTVQWLKNALCGDYESTLSFLGVLNRDANKSDLDYVQALKANPKMLHDPFVVKRVYDLIKKKIDEAKIGKLIVNGNYQIASGDPYALAQNMFGLEVTGILKANEIYSSYWVDKGEKEVLLFRSPMTSHNNIRKGHLNASDKAIHWYKHMHNVMIMSAWDTFCMAMNGEDFDGDQNFSTNNSILLKNYVPMPPINCVQRKAQKNKVTEELLQKSNIDGFGNGVGVITNRVTTMYDLIAKYEKGSEEYNELYKRIIAGQLYQQAEIDKIKGIVSSPMPRCWYDKGACETELEKNTVVDKKPRFMTYIYPKEKLALAQHEALYKKSCLQQFGMQIEQLKAKEYRTEDENVLYNTYVEKYPVYDCGSLMSRICVYIEDTFKDAVSNFSDKNFDYSILKSEDEEAKYTTRLYNKVKALYDEFKKKMYEFKTVAKKQKLDKDNVEEQKDILVNLFKEKSLECCKGNEQILCNIVIDMCYKNDGTKQFAYSVSLPQILKNLSVNK